jgi:hypothetical protein
MKYARFDGTTVIEVYTVPTGFTINDCFHADLVAKMVACTDDVQVGWTYADGVFTDPNATQEQTTDTPAE